MKLLWIRVGALGDLLISTQALAETPERFPGHDIYVVGPKLWLEVLVPGQWPQIKGVIVLQGSSRGQLFVRADGEAANSNSKTAWVPSGEEKSLHAFFQDADITVNLRIESYRFAWGPFFARVPTRIGSCPWPMKWLYTHWSPWLGKEPPIHERDWYSLVVRAPKRSWFPVGFEKQNRLELLGGVFLEDVDSSARPQGGLPTLKVPDILTVERLTRGRARFGRYWIINPTASRIEKAWPAEKFAALADRLLPILKKHEMELLILGAPNETQWLQKVAREKFVIVQPNHFHELIDVVAGARLLIANTSSVQFFAAGTKTPTVTLMGRSTPLRWGPVGNHDRVIVGKVPKGFRGSIFEEELAAYDSLSVDYVYSKICSEGEGPSM